MNWPIAIGVVVCIAGVISYWYLTKNPSSWVVNDTRVYNEMLARGDFNDGRKSSAEVLEEADKFKTYFPDYDSALRYATYQQIYSKRTFTVDQVNKLILLDK